MTAGLRPPVVLDTTVLSNFTSCKAVAWLGSHLPEPVVIPAVQDELQAGIEHGHRYLEAATDTIDEGMAISETATDSIEGTNWKAIRERLDRGEAASLLTALERDGTLATDDLAARGLARDYGVPVTGSIGLLAWGVERGILARGLADTWLAPGALSAATTLLSMASMTCWEPRSERWPHVQSSSSHATV